METLTAKEINRMELESVKRKKLNVIRDRLASVVLHKLKIKLINAVAMLQV